MVIACWGPKGGSGTTTVSVALASLLARQSTAGALLVDASGDAPAVLGLPEAVGPGLAEWLAAGPGVPSDALRHLEVEAGCNLWLITAGGVDADGPSDASRAGLTTHQADGLVEALGRCGRPVVVDAGSGFGSAPALVAAATDPILVLRPCYLALRRALAAPVRAAGAVLVVDEGRSLGAADVSDVLGVPVLAVVPVDAAIARSVDAGLLGRRLPRSLARSLRGLAADLVEPSTAESRPAEAGRVRLRP